MLGLSTIQIKGLREIKIERKGHVIFLFRSGTSSTSNFEGRKGKGGEYRKLLGGSDGLRWGSVGVTSGN